MEAELLERGDYNDKVHSSKDTNGDVNHSGDGPIVNGFSNGLDNKSSKKDEHRDKHKDKHKDKHRDKDREREKDKSRDRDKDKSRDKDREREKDRDKHREKDKDHKSSSHKSSSKDKDRDKDKERRDKDREKDKDRQRDKDREKDGKDDKSSPNKDKEKSSSSSNSKHHSSSSSSKSDRDKHKSSSSSSRDKDRHRDKDKEKDREKDKDRHRDKDKEKEREKSKHSSSSSSKDKEKRDKSSSDKSKDSHKDRSSSSNKEKLDKSHREKENSSGEKEDSKSKVKRSTLLDDSFETEQEVKPVVIKEEVEVKQEQDSFKVEEMDDNDDDGDDEDALYIKEEPQDDMDTTNDTTFDNSKIKQEDTDDDDDVPLSSRASKRPPTEDEDDDDMPLAKKKIKKEKESKKKRKKDYESEEEDFDEEEEDFKPKKKKKSSAPPKKIKTEVKVKNETSFSDGSAKKKKKPEQETEVWKWWEEEKKDSKTKWNFLEHKGPVFAPPYEPLPNNVKFHYDGKEIKLSEDAEEVATFYARMLEHDYVTKDAFNTNFLKDWRKMMTPKEKDLITDLRKCNFKPMHAYFVQKSEERKQRTKEEKNALKEENEKLIEEYGFCTIDGHKEKIGNFKLEPPGLFRGRGEHPKMGMLKRRLNAEDIIINCSKDSEIPKPPEGHRWKEVRHDNTVTWLASWTENVQGQVKYIMLNPSSKLKGEKDWQKYETARKLHKCIDKIRREYKEDWKSKEMRIRQRAVALYFIDKLALRAGNEKDEDQADTVGCCSLRVEHIELHPERDGKEFVVVFDFLGKDSIRYYNEVPVEKRVFKNVQLFVEGKKPGDDLFDRLNTQILNKHLNELMEGLTAKVFRTYNASITLQEQLNLLTDPNYSPPEKLLAYNRANRAVAILCNHQRSIPKSHQKSMENLKEKISAKKEAVEEAEKYLKNAKRDAKNGSAKEKIVADKAKKKLERLKEQLTKLEVQETDREENKTIALGTSKLNYLDPRISVAWCKKNDIPIDKVYNKTQRSKFRWAIDMAGPDYVF